MGEVWVNKSKEKFEAIADRWRWTDRKRIELLIDFIDFWSDLPDFEEWLADREVIESYAKYKK